MTVTAVDTATAQGGTVAANNNGTPDDPADDVIVYTPAPDVVGPDTFAYTIADPAGNTDTAVVTVEVTASGADPRPTAAGDRATTPQSVAVAIAVLANDTHPQNDNVTLTAVTGGAHGTVSLDDNGTPADPTDDVVRYTPNPGFAGQDTFTYTIVDANGDLALAAVTVTVTNAPPVANDDSATTTEDTPVTIAILDTDTDADGTLDTASVVLVDAPAHGMATVNIDGTTTYTPEINFSGTDTFTYTVQDDTGLLSNVATVTLMVTPVNDPPMALDDRATTDEDTSVTVALLDNDRDVDGSLDPVSVTIVGGPAHGAVVDNGDGTVTYAPTAGFNGADTFTYTVQDNGGAVSNVATATVVVGPVNDPPVAVDDGATTSEDTPVTITIVTNDRDVDGSVDPASVAVVDGPVNGAVVINADGAVVYTPNEDFSGTDTLTYTVTDDMGELSNIATVTVTVAPINDSPLAVDDTATTDEDTPATIVVMANDTDIDGTVDPASVTLITTPANGAVTIQTDGAVTYIPNADFHGTDRFTYTVTDDMGDVSNIATVIITALAVNDPPVAHDDAATTDRDTPITIAVVTNDSDVDGTVDPASVALVDAPTSGLVAVNADGTVLYTPETDVLGMDTFTYTVNDDSRATSNIATVTIRVGNRLPVAEADSASTPPETSVAIPVLINDSDLDADPLTITSILIPPGDGTVTFTPDGEVIYTPDPGVQDAVDTFIYVVSDGQGGTATAFVTVTVDLRTPQAVAERAAAPVDTPVTIPVLMNDTDPNGAFLQPIIVATPPNGTVTVNDDGTVTYTPNPGFVGVDSFTYQIVDPEGHTDTAIVAVVVNDDAPAALGDAAVAPADTPVVIDVLANDTDPNNDPLIITSFTQGANGLVIVNDNGLTYVPNLGFTGTDIFTYTIADPQGNTTLVTATVTISAPPVAVDDRATTLQEMPTLVAVLANDSDPDGMLAAGMVMVTGAPGNGSVTVMADGIATYTPDAGFTGADVFTYIVQDNVGLVSNEAIVTITVVEANDPPAAADDTAATPIDTPVTIAVLSNDADPDGDGLTLIDVSEPANGTAVIDADGTVIYTPSTGFTGTDTFTYTLEDMAGNTATVMVTVVVDDNAPVAAGDGAVTQVNTPVTIPVLANDTDPTDDPLTIVGVTDGANGAVMRDANGTPDNPRDDTVGYTPALGFTGIDTFTYTIDDGGGNTATATVTVVVNAPPLAAADMVTTPPDTPVTVAVLANDRDNDGMLAPNTVTVTSGPENGMVTVNIDGAVTYTPNAGFSGSDTFTYTVDDNHGAVSNAAAVTVAVTVANASPVVTNDAVTMPEDLPIVVPILDNDNDADGTIDPGTVTVTSGPRHGTATSNADGTVTYTPNPNFAGVDMFVYTVNDDDGASSDAATVTITVSAVNDPPLAIANGAATSADTPVVVFVLANDRDTDSALDPSTVTITSAPASGRATVDAATGAITYTPPENFRGAATFAYTVADDSGAVSNEAAVTVTVGNTPPVAASDSAATPLETSVAIPVLVNDVDADADPLLVTDIAALPSNGAVTFTPEGEVIYTPNSGFTGTDTFVYTIRDTQGGAATASVTLTVDNNAPTAVADTTATTAGTPVTVHVLVNDADPNSDPLMIVGVSEPRQGSVTINADGTLTYTSDPDVRGFDTFLYTIADSDGHTAMATVTVVLDGQAPVVVGDGVDAGADGVVMVNILANDIASNGEPLTIVTLTQGANGTVTLNDNDTPDDTGDDAVTYLPNAGFTGSDTFTYTVRDTRLQMASAAATVRISAAPVATDLAVTTAGDTPVTIDVVANATDADGTIDPASVLLLAAPTNGAAVVNANGTVTYTPAGGFRGSDTFTYTVRDNNGVTSAPATVTVEVDNIAPLAIADSAATPFATSVAFAVLANDTDPNGDPLTVVAVTQPPAGAGTVAIAPNGEIIYTPADGFSGTTTFTYTVDDGQGGTASASITVTVAGVVITNLPPTAVADSSSTRQETSVAIMVLANDGDPDGDPLTIVAVTDGAHGTVTVDNNGTPDDPTDDQVVYTPEPNFVGTDIFTYRIMDASGEMATATVTITVTAPNTPPIIRDDMVITVTDTPVAVDVLANDSDPDGGPIVIDQFDAVTANGGTVVQNDNGTLTDPTDDFLVYTPLLGFAEVDTFAYTARDDQGGTGTASVLINFVFDPPSGGKVVNALGGMEFEWRMVWINNANTVANRIRVSDGVPAGTTYIPDSVACAGRGETTVERCVFDAAANLIVYEGNIGPDTGALTEEEAANEIVIAYRFTVHDGILSVENQATANWDANGDGSVEDDIAAGQAPILTDDPTSLAEGDATVLMLSAGACLFQARPALVAPEPADPDGQQSNGAADPADPDGQQSDGAADPADGAVDALGGAADDGVNRSVLRANETFALTTPRHEVVVAGTAVTVAALQLPNTEAAISPVTRVTVANDDLQIPIDIAEDAGNKREALTATSDQVVVVASGVIVEIPVDALPADDVLQIESIAIDDAPGALPGDDVGQVFVLTRDSAQSRFANPVRLHVPYADADSDGRAEGAALPIAAADLTLWAFDEATAQWVQLPETTVFPAAKALVVETTRLGFFGVFRVADAPASTLGRGNGMGTMAARAITPAETQDDTWTDIGMVMTAPFLVPWDTTQLDDGAYELRAICAEDAGRLDMVLSAAPSPSVGRAGAAEGGGDNCFIATAAYGSLLEPQVQVLRTFRDTHLLPYAWGRWFVTQYYTWSPPLAAVIRTRPALRATVRLGLTPVVWVAGAYVDGTSQIAWMFLLGSGCGLGWVVWRRRRSG